MQGLHDMGDSSVAPREPGKKKTTSLGTWITLAVVVVILAAIAVPDMKDYEMRAKVNEARSVAMPVLDTIESFYTKQGKLPFSSSDAPELGVALSAANKYLPVTVTGGRVVVIPPRMGPSAAIYLTPSVQGGRMTWICSAPSIQASYLPSECR
jgi:Tfp pilus assembly major pilin PilA